jgi:hypothetical protein
MLNPTVMKKNPSRRPLKGAMSASIWYLYFVSASNSPARKAPRVLERPMPVRWRDVMRGEGEWRNSMGRGEGGDEGRGGRY